MSGNPLRPPPPPLVPAKPVSVVRFRTPQVPRQADEKCRIRIRQGPDLGLTFVLTRMKASIGRGEENDIVLSDLKTSRAHAVLSLLGAQWKIRDLGSANGLLINGRSTREAALESSDLVSLGETQFEFLTTEAPTSVVEAAVLYNLRSSTPAKRPKSKAASRKNLPLLIGVGALIALMLTLPSGAPKPPVARKVSARVASADLLKYIPTIELNKTAGTLFKEGMREYLNGNYNRARVQFETVLQISPAHQLAARYLDNCQHAITDAVKLHLEYGEKALSSGKLRDARSHFEYVMRLLYRSPTHAAYREAKEKLDEVTTELNQSEWGS